MSKPKYNFSINCKDSNGKTAIETERGELSKVVSTTVGMFENSINDIDIIVYREKSPEDVDTAVFNVSKGVAVSRFSKHNTNMPKGILEELRSLAS